MQFLSTPLTCAVLLVLTSTAVFAQAMPGDGLEDPIETEEVVVANICSCNYSGHTALRPSQPFAIEEKEEASGINQILCDAAASKADQDYFDNQDKYVVHTCMPDIPSKLCLCDYTEYDMKYAENGDCSQFEVPVYSHSSNPVWDCGSIGN